MLNLKTTNTPIFWFSFFVCDIVAEDNPLFDYPDEVPSNDEEERDPYDYCENGSDIYDKEIADISYDDDDEEEKEHWRMGHC